MNEQDSFDSVIFARDFLAYTQSRIEHADQKLHLLLAADAVLVALLTSSAPGLLADAFTQSASVLDVISGVVTLLLLAAVGCSILFAFLTLKPRLEVGAHDSLFYFKHISERSTEQFIEEYLAISRERAIEDLLEQVHANSQIAAIKFKLVRISTYAFVAALSLWIILLIVEMLA